MTTHNKRIGLFQTNQRQQPFAVFVNGAWRIWISYNPTVTSGTYLHLLPTGSVDRVTVLEDDVVEITKVV